MSKIVKVTDKDYDSEEYEIPSVNDLIIDHYDEIDNLELSDDLIKKMAEAIMYEPEARKSDYKIHIEIIYMCIISILYIEEDIKDPSYIYRMIPHMSYLRGDFDLENYKDLYHMDELCEQIYHNTRDRAYKQWLPEEMPEEFKFENIMNPKYIINKMYEKNKDNEYLKEVFASEPWRFAYGYF